MLQDKSISPEDFHSIFAPAMRGARGSSETETLAEDEQGQSDSLTQLSEKFGVPGIDLKATVFPLSNLSLIPLSIAKQHLVLPFLGKGDQLWLAMADPGQRRVVEEVEFATGKSVFAYVASKEVLREVTDEAYSMAARGETYYVGSEVSSEQLEALGLVSAAGDISQAQKGGPEDAPGSVMAGGPANGDAGKGTEDAPCAATARGLPRELDPAFEEELQSTPPPPDVEARQKTRVLVVDDEEGIRAMLRKMLTQNGFEVWEASTGTEALERVRERVPDLILLDAMLPQVHGFEICRRLKGSERYGHIPIIMLSAVYRGWRFAEDLTESYGVEHFVEKPFRMQELMAVIRRVLEGRDETTSQGAEEVPADASKALTDSAAAFKRGDMDEAVFALEQAVKVDPLVFRLHYNLGLLCGRRDDLFRAIHCLETALSLRAKHFGALKNLAVLYQRAGFRHKSIEMWERALTSAPDDQTRQGIKEHLMGLL